MHPKIEEILEQALSIYLEKKAVCEKIDNLCAKRRMLQQELNNLVSRNFSVEEEFDNYLYRDGGTFYLVTLNFDEVPAVNFYPLESVNFSPSHIVDEIDDDDNLAA